VLTVAAMRVARDGNGSFVTGTMGGGAGAIVDQLTLAIHSGGSVEFAVRRSGERAKVRVVVRSKVPVTLSLAGDVRLTAVWPVEGDIRFTAAPGASTLGVRTTGDAVAEVELMAPRGALLRIWAVDEPTKAADREMTSSTLGLH
jgi:hypothetical protein